jgi:type IV pilus biogenesis protein PilP
MSTPETKFAVDLSNDGMSLWHRHEGSAWKLVGKVALSAENFSDDIEKLKSGHTPNAAGKFIAQVRIPNSEVFTSDINLKGAKGDKITSAVNEFLTRNTPYAADDLIFDLSNVSGQAVAYIAAIAKETIAEAREFITSYGFEAAYYTTKLDKGAFPQNPRFYDLDNPVTVAKETPVAAPARADDIAPPPPPAKVTKKPRDKKPVVAVEKTNLSGFETIRNKSNTAPDKQALTTKPPTPTTQPRRISIGMPAAIEPAPLVPVPLVPVSLKTSPPKKAERIIAPIKMPQSKTIKTDMRGVFKPRYILVLIALVLLGLMYWLYSFLIDGKEEITRLQQISNTPPMIITTPQSMAQKTSLDDVPSSFKEVPVAALSQGTDMEDTFSTLNPPKPLNTVANSTSFATAKNPAKQTEPAIDTALADQEQIEVPQDPVATAQITKPVEQVLAKPETALEQVAIIAPLVPTRNGTPGPEGITLYLGQPEFQPPLREQLKISQDPLRDILPKMRSKEFEELNKTENLPTPDVPEPSTDITDIAEAAEPAEQPVKDTPDLLALADPALKSKLPKPRPASISQTAKELQNSLLARADPALASSKPKPRPADLSVPVVRIDPVDIEIAIQQAVAETARPRPRPRSLSNTVKRAKANVQTASLTPPAATGTSVASNPSPVNIQKEATEKSRFSKRRISLVGVYGTPAKRRALVRMPSGRYVKVTQGQKFSGWKVSAIGESTVRITKGSRNQVLRMPK